MAMVRSWSATRGKRTRYTLLNPGGRSINAVSAVAFSTDGRFLAAALPEGVVRNWDRRRNRQLPWIRIAETKETQGGVAPNTRAEAIAFDPRTGLLAAGQFDGRIRLWDIQTGKPVGPEFGVPVPADDYHSIGVQSLGFTADGKFLVSGHGGDATSQTGAANFRLWKAREGFVLDRTLSSGLRGARALAVHPKSNLIACGAAADAVDIIDLDSGMHRQLRRSTRADTAGDGRVAASALTFDQTGDLLAAGFSDGMVALWHGPERQDALPLDVFGSGPSGSAETLAFSPVAGTLATGGMDGVVRLWRSNPEPAGEPLGATDPLYAAAFSHDGGVLATTGVAGKLQWWDVAHRSRIAEYELPGKTVGVAVAFEGKREATLVNRAGAKLRCTPRGCAEEKRKAFAAAEYRGGWSASFTADSQSWFEWRARPYRCDLPNGCVALPGGAHQGEYAEAASADGSRWAIRGWEEGNGTISFCRSSGCRRLDVGSGGLSNWIGGIQFDPSGSLLVAGTGEGRVVFFDGQTGARLGPPVQAHTGGVEFIAFTPDGKIMASAGRGGTVLLWNVAARQPISAPFPRLWVESGARAALSSRR